MHEILLLNWQLLIIYGMMLIQAVDPKLPKSRYSLNFTPRNFKLTLLKPRLFALGMPNGRIIIAVSTNRYLERSGAIVLH